MESDDLSAKIADIDEKIAKMNNEIKGYEKYQAENPKKNGSDPKDHYQKPTIPSEDQGPKFRKNAEDKEPQGCKLCSIF